MKRTDAQIYKLLKDIKGEFRHCRSAIKTDLRACKGYMVNGDVDRTLAVIEAIDELLENWWSHDIWAPKRNKKTDLSPSARKVEQVRARRRAK